MLIHLTSPLRQHLHSASPRGFRRTGIALATGFALTVVSVLAGPTRTGWSQAAEPAAESNESTNEAETETDRMRALQRRSIVQQRPVYGYWGTDRSKFSSWTNHSNRLVPLYTFGITLSDLREEGSVYADAERFAALAGEPGEGSVNSLATYHDQTDVYRLQKMAFHAGFTNIILMVFDGMDWETTRAAAMYHSGEIGYTSGRGTGLAILDERRTKTDFGLICTSAAATGAKVDVDSQQVLSVNQSHRRGFDVALAGRAPWHEKTGSEYLLGRDRSRPHTVTDSASSATSLCSGIKTYNGAINVALDGEEVIPIARELQRDQDLMVGIVTSVPVSHATPASAYANNVSRKDYQDISRDLIGLPSSFHRGDPLPGVDVLIGGGWGEGKGDDKLQGRNFAQGNPYIHQDDVRSVDVAQGGRSRVVQRTAGQPGGESLLAAAQKAADRQERLLGLFGTKGGHLPFATADGDYQPTLDVRATERYTADDVAENPTLAEMTKAALVVLEQSIDGFWLMIEAGDVDWANHANNLDSSIGAVLSGDAAFQTVMEWIDANAAWDHTAVIVTSDHGHYLVIEDDAAIAAAGASRRND